MKSIVGYYNESEWKFLEKALDTTPKPPPISKSGNVGKNKEFRQWIEEGNLVRFNFKGING